jgi:hypothetical protein
MLRSCHMLAVPAENGTEGRLVELVSGVDALYVSGWADLPTGLLVALADAREAAEASGEAVPFEYLEDGWSVAPHGFGLYRYCLIHEAARVGVTASERLPSLRVQARSSFLHAAGPRPAMDYFAEIGERLAGGPVSWGVSRLDLFCDVQGWTLTGDDRHRFVCRAAKRDLHEDSEEFTGIGFGRRTTKTISARIYDKTIETQAKGTDWWPLVWGSRYDPELPVLRVEFELGRTGLLEHGVDTPDEAFDALGGLWGSCTETWLTYRSLSADATKSRRPIAPEWEAIQAASMRQAAIGLARVRAGARAGELRKLTPSLVGYCASVGAILDLPDLGSTMAAVRHLIEADERQRGVAFTERIAERRAKEPAA